MFLGLQRRCEEIDLPQRIGVLERRMHILAKGYFFRGSQFVKCIINYTLQAETA